MSQDRDRPPPELMTTAEVAVMLRASPKTIRRAIHAGRLPARKLIDGNWRVRRADVEALIVRTSTVPSVPSVVPSTPATEGSKGSAPVTNGQGR